MTVHYSGHPIATAGLVTAGLLPFTFNSQTLSAVYFALLIPPAAYHCWSFIHDTLLPLLKKKNDKSN